MQYKRMEIYMVNLGLKNGSVQGEVKPCVVVSNDVGNTYSNILTVIPLTSKKFDRKKQMPTHTIIPKGNANLRVDSIAMAEQIRTISQSQIQFKIGKLENQELIKQIEDCMMIALGIVTR